MPTDTDICRRQHGLSIRRYRKRMNGSVCMLTEARHVKPGTNVNRAFRRKDAQTARMVVVRMA